MKKRELLDDDRLPSEMNFNHLKMKSIYRDDFTSDERQDVFDYIDLLFTSCKYANCDSVVSNNLLGTQIRNYNKINLNLDDTVQLPSYCNNRIDVIWTCVNGSDPHWIKSYEDHLNIRREGERYREYGSLKYSMRSVYENFPYDIHWHLIVQDEWQIPTFLNKSKLIYYNDESKPETLRIIYHRDYFPDPSVLPVFNSNAIEIAMYNLEGVGECAIYLNDDFFINAPVKPTLMFERDGRIKSYMYQNICGKKNSGSYFDKANFNSIDLVNGYNGEEFRLHRSAHHWFLFRMSVFKRGGELFKNYF